MNKELAKQLRIAADIEEGKATYGWEAKFGKDGWESFKVAHPAKLALDGYQLRIRHKWQDCIDAEKGGAAIEGRIVNGGFCPPGEWLPIAQSDWDRTNAEFRIAPKLTFPTPPEGEELVTEYEGRQFTPQEFGCPEWRPLLKSEMESRKPIPNTQWWGGPDWKNRDCMEDLLHEDIFYRTREPFPQPKPLELLTPGDGREIHNPENLTAEQVGKGYRVLLKEEYDGRHDGKAELWSNSKTWQLSPNARLINWTFRVPATIPWPPKKESEYIPLDLEDWLKDGPWGIINQECKDDESFHLVTQVHVDHITFWDGSCHYIKTHEQIMASKRRNFAGREELCRKPKP